MAAEHQLRIGARIRKVREAKGWTQAQLARELPGTVDGPSVSRWERGKVMPQPETLEVIAKALGVGVAYFYVSEANGDETPDVLGAMADGSRSQLDRIEAKLDRLLAVQPDTAIRELDASEEAAAQRAKKRAATGKRTRRAQGGSGTAG